MIRFFRFLGIVMIAFMIPLVHSGAVAWWAAVIVLGIANSVSNLCYYELGLRDEEL